ncbi:unnamed protein product [Pylaiella littoralis]
MEGGLADMTGLSSDNSGNNLETRRATPVAGGFDFMEDRPLHARGARSGGGGGGKLGTDVRRGRKLSAPDQPPAPVRAIAYSKQRAASLFDLLQELSVPPKPKGSSSDARAAGACGAPSAPAVSSACFARDPREGSFVIASDEEQRQQQQQKATSTMEKMGKISKERGRQGAAAPVLRKEGQGHNQRAGVSSVEEARCVTFVVEEARDYARRNSNNGSSSSSSSSSADKICGQPNATANPTTRGATTKRKSVPVPLGTIAPNNNTNDALAKAVAATSSSSSSPSSAAAPRQQRRGGAAAAAAAAAPRTAVAAGATMTATAQERSTRRRRVDGGRRLDSSSGGSGGSIVSGGGAESAVGKRSAIVRGRDVNTVEDDAGGLFSSWRGSSSTPRREEEEEGGGGGYIGMPTAGRQGEDSDEDDERAVHRVDARARSRWRMPQDGEDSAQWMKQEPESASTAVAGDDGRQWWNSSSLDGLGDPGGGGGGGGGSGGAKGSSQTISQQQQQQQQHHHHHHRKEKSEGETDSVGGSSGSSDSWRRTYASSWSEKSTQGRRGKRQMAEHGGGAREPSRSSPKEEACSSSSGRASGETERKKRAVEAAGNASSGDEDCEYYDSAEDGRGTGAVDQLQQQQQQKELLGVRGLCRMRGSVLALVEWRVTDPGGAAASTELSFVLSSTLKTEWPQQYIAYLEGKMVFDTEGDAAGVRHRTPASMVVSGTSSNSSRTLLQGKTHSRVCSGGKAHT